MDTGLYRELRSPCNDTSLDAVLAPLSGTSRFSVTHELSGTTARDTETQMSRVVGAVPTEPNERPDIAMARSEKQQVYLQTVSRKNVQQAKAEYQVREETRERDLKALEVLQANRPDKPPGRR